MPTDMPGYPTKAAAIGRTVDAGGFVQPRRAVPRVPDMGHMPSRDPHWKQVITLLDGSGPRLVDHSPRQLAVTNAGVILDPSVVLHGQNAPYCNGSSTYASVGTIAQTNVMHLPEWTIDIRFRIPFFPAAVETCLNTRSDSGNWTYGFDVQFLASQGSVGITDYWYDYGLGYGFDRVDTALPAGTIVPLKVHVASFCKSLHNAAGAPVPTLSRYIDGVPHGSVAITKPVGNVYTPFQPLHFGVLNNGSLQRYFRGWLQARITLACRYHGAHIPDAVWPIGG
jgi:hypothetical protein